ncbi:glycosyltransferase family 25 protein [Sphingomonas sp.]|uniref:glycosyltransferase family 25 protein n=1 Tax=Sphingomonas sp. TaxID=28214 RepID=UPI00333FAF89
MSGDPTIRVISLQHSDRRPAVAGQLRALRRSWAFFDAIDHVGPAGLHYDPGVARRRFGRELGAAELGIFASHIALWRQAAAADHGSIWLILEDDVTFEPHFATLLDEIVARMRDRRIDFLRLFAITEGPRVQEARFASFDLYRYIGDCWGTQAYLLTPAGAHRLLAAICRVERPIDNELDRYWHHGLPDRVTIPLMVRHNLVPSTAEAERATMERDRQANRQWRRWLYYRSRAVMGWHGSLTRIALALGRR